MPDAVDLTVFGGKERKVIVSDLLYFLYNKFNRDPRDNVISTCLKFAPYSELVIFDEKTKFFSAIGGKCIDRRTDKKSKDLEDILTAMSQRDATGDEMPMFVSSNMNNIPWASDGNATNSQILSSIHDLKNNLVTKEHLNDALSQLRNEFVSTSRGAESPLTPRHRRTLPTTPKSSSLSSDSTLVHPEPPSLQLVQLQTTIPELNQETNPKLPVASATPLATSSIRGQGREVSTNVGDDGYRQVVRGRKMSKSSVSKPPISHRSNSRQIVIGKKVMNGTVSLKGADLTVNRYVGNVDIGATTDQIRDFLIQEGVAVVELEENKTQHSRFKSFRLRIRKDDLSKIDDPNFWPEKVVIRPFFRPKSNGAVKGATFAGGRLSSTSNNNNNNIDGRDAMSSSQN